jgi:hypothetical protein
VYTSGQNNVVEKAGSQRSQTSARWREMSSTIVISRQYAAHAGISAIVDCHSGNRDEHGAQACHEEHEEHEAHRMLTENGVVEDIEGDPEQEC